jgi:hypothetical protein
MVTKQMLTYLSIHISFKSNQLGQILFAIDYAGYLLSPTHKCVMIGNRYFGTSFKTYYKVLGIWSLLLIITAGLLTFL